VASNATANASTRIEALEVLGGLHASQGHNGSARQAFERLLTLDPGHQILDISVPEVVLDLFREVRSTFHPQIAISIEVQAPAVIPASDPILIEATLSGDLAGANEIVLFSRSDGERAFGRVDMRCDHAVCIVELLRPEEGVGIEYYIEVLAPSGFCLDQIGSISEPRRIESRGMGRRETEDSRGDDRGRPRWYRSWWFWTIVGALVVGGTTAAVVLAWPEETPPDGNLGSLYLP
jgi:hypothetical protein